MIKNCISLLSTDRITEIFYTHIKKLIKSTFKADAGIITANGEKAVIFATVMLNEPFALVCPAPNVVVVFPPFPPFPPVVVPIIPEPPVMFVVPPVAVPPAP